MLIDLVHIKKQFGSQVLFRDLSLRIVAGDRIGLVGSNGSGKSSLFKMIMNEMQPDEGEVVRRKTTSVGYVQQEVDRAGEGPLLRAVVDRIGDLKAVSDRRLQLIQQIEARDGDLSALTKALGEVEDRFAAQGGYEIEGRAKAVLCGLGFSERDLERDVMEFSGGWLMRAQLASVLLREPDILLLDEPTNHLDLESLMWFETYLKTYAGCLVIVAHDREFLNRTVTRVVELSRGECFISVGDYDRYLAFKAEQGTLLEKAHQAQQAKIRELEGFIERNRARASTARRAQSRMKELEKVERIALPNSERRVAFRFPQPERTGKVVAEVTDLQLRYGEKVVFAGVDFSLFRGERVALVGPNGAGKSTLLKVLAGVLPLSGGKRELGVNVSVDYFAQHQLEVMNPARTVMEEMMTRSGDETISFIRGILGGFLFSGEAVDKRVAALSGGEKSRLALAKMLMRPASLFLMDEPTNHLDIPSRELLETALNNYSGSLCFVSHDRRFIDALATRVVDVEGGRLEAYPGNYSYFESKKAQLTPQPTAPLVVEVAADDADAASRRERRRREAEARKERYVLLKPLRDRLTQVEESIAETEEQIGLVEAEMATPAFYQDERRAKERTRAYQELKQSLATLYEEWESIGEEMESID